MMILGEDWGRVNMKDFSEWLIGERKTYDKSLESVGLGFPDLHNSKLMSEGIIIPITFKLKSLNVDYLNNNQILKDLNITFNKADESFYKDGRITIGIKSISTIEQLSSKIGHELIHAIQDERSKKQYLNFHNSLEKLWNKSLSKLDSLSPSDIKDLRSSIILKRDFLNPYEKMAYAYEIVSQAKLKSVRIEHIIQWINEVYPEFTKDKQFLKYLYEYYTNII